jgi:hypothetical protein
MKRKMLLATVLLLIFSTTLAMKPASAVDTLSPNDFKLQSFSKTVDFFDFVRSYAASHGMTPPNASLHAYLYQTYINVSGFQLYYSGLINITAGQGALTIPVQSFMEHYKTPAGKDVLMSSSFIMLLAFNDTASSLHDDSPDKNDNLYASFSLGLDLTSLYGSHPQPALSSKTTIIPLESSNNDLTWEWGMRYTNLTAVWWRIYIDPLHPLFRTAVPIAITTYEELTFMYKLTINPTDHKATVTASYVIGRMTNLWLIQWFILPIVTHYNSTGHYWLNGKQISDETIYQFLESQHIKMSIVLFQNSLVLDGTTKSTFNNQNVTDAEYDVSNGKISTSAGSEKIFDADFGTKKQYKLYNYTDSTETTYNATTRTVPRAGFAKNPLFSMHVALLKYVPLIVKHIDPSLYEKAKDHMLNMTYADYFYITSYPKYSGFKITHDPTYTAYIAATTSPTAGLPNLFGLIIVGAIVAVAVIGAVLVLRRRGLKTQSMQPTTPTTPAPATT